MVRPLGSDYLEWFVDNGTLIALVFALVSVAVDLNRHSGLIAATPSGFVSAILGVFAELGESLGSLFAEPRADVDLWDSGLATLTSRYRSRALDTVFGGIFLGLFFVVMAGWLFVIAPVQYFLNLPCGAPARMALTSERTIWVVNSPGRYWYTIGSKDEVDDAKERGATEISFATKPVTLTSGVSALVLWGVSQFV